MDTVSKTNISRSVLMRSRNDTKNGFKKMSTKNRNRLSTHEYKGLFNEPNKIKSRKNVSAGK